MQRNMPNYALLADMLNASFGRLTLQLAHPANVSESQFLFSRYGLTWIPSKAIGAGVVTRYSLDKFLQRALIAHLLTLARHDETGYLGIQPWYLK